MNSMTFSPRGNVIKRELSKKSNTKDQGSVNQSVLLMHGGGSALMNPQTHESSTEKLLMSNDKVTVKELWSSTPKPDFTNILADKLEFESFLQEAKNRDDALKNKIEKKKIEIKKQEKEKEEEKARQQEIFAEQRRVKLE